MVLPFGLTNLLADHSEEVVARLTLIGIVLESYNQCLFDD